MLWSIMTISEVIRITLNVCVCVGCQNLCLCLEPTHMARSTATTNNFCCCVTFICVCTCACVWGFFFFLSRQSRFASHTFRAVACQSHISCQHAGIHHRMNHLEYCLLYHKLIPQCCWFHRSETLWADRSFKEASRQAVMIQPERYL